MEPKTQGNHGGIHQELAQFGVIKYLGRGSLVYKMPWTRILGLYKMNFHILLKLGLVDRRHSIQPVHFFISKINIVGLSFYKHHISIHIMPCNQSKGTFKGDV